MEDKIIELFHSCGAPLIMFIVGLFFPQVKIKQILEAFRFGAEKPKE